MLNFTRRYRYFNKLLDKYFVSTQGSVQLGNTVDSFAIDVYASSPTASWFYQRQTARPQDLEAITTQIRLASREYPFFEAKRALVVTWHTSENNSSSNLFQFVIATDEKNLKFQGSGPESGGCHYRFWLGHGHKNLRRLDQQLELRHARSIHFWG